jgi:DNA repair protein RadD
MALRDYQLKLKANIYAAWDEGAKHVMSVAPTGSGKCLGRGTPILMFDGTVKLVEDVRVGDFLMGPDSSPRGVVSLARGREAMYRVVPVKGEAHLVNESHILALRLTPERRGSVPMFENISVREFLSKTKTYRHRAKLWRASVDWRPNPLPLDPYFFGLWLGDGHSRLPAVTKPDKEVLRAVQDVAAQHECSVRTEAGDRCATHHIVGTRGKRNPVTEKLDALGVLNNKHVPLCYRAAPRSVRLQVLAGLLDSDGSLSTGGFDFISSLPALSDGVVFLCRSLGLAAYVRSCRKKCQTGAEGTYYRVSISGDCSVIPTRLPRKKAPPRSQIKDVTAVGFHLEAVGEDEYFGFEIAGADRLFVLGDLTVTHNTVVLGAILKEKGRPACAIAHRQELVSQLALALNREGVRHDIIAPQNVVREIVRSEIETHGVSHYKLRAETRVAGVNTLAIRDKSDPWFQQVEYVVVDEGHHVLRENIFGKALLAFPNARGLLPTAHAIRADGRGLGAHADGLVDRMVLGPSARALINRGFLADYRLIAPPSDVDVSSVPLGSTGDFSAPKLRLAVHESRTIVGDVVREYLRFAPGKLGLTFAVDIESAEEIVTAFKAANVRAEIITANTPISERAKLMRQFRARDILQLVSVDVLGEGTDVPAVEIISMARPTQSFQLYSQQFGRSLRVSVAPHLAEKWDQFTDAERLAHIAASDKPKAIIIDHVGNWSRPGFGLPDVARRYSLDRRERRQRPEGEIPLKLCAECLEPYEAIYAACPHCGAVKPPRNRSAPEHVDGDLAELDPEVLAQLRSSVERIDGPPRIPHNADAVVAGAIKKRHRERQQAQSELRASIALWAGFWKMHRANDSESYRRFFHTFGWDVLSAQSLGARDAAELALRVNAEIERLNIVEEQDK